MGFGFARSCGHMVEAPLVAEGFSESVKCLSDVMFSFIAFSLNLVKKYFAMNIVFVVINKGKLRCLKCPIRQVDQLRVCSRRFQSFLH